MLAPHRQLPAPPIVRKIGWYQLAIGTIGVGGIVMTLVYDNTLRWYQVVATGAAVSAGAGLVLERRWAYVIAMVLLAVDVVVLASQGVMIIGQFSQDEFPLVFLFWMIGVALALPIVLLLRAPARRWFLEE